MPEDGCVLSAAASFLPFPFSFRRFAGFRPLRAPSFLALHGRVSARGVSAVGARARLRRSRATGFRSSIHAKTKPATAVRSRRPLSATATRRDILARIAVSLLAKIMGILPYAFPFCNPFFFPFPLLCDNGETARSGFERDFAVQRRSDCIFLLLFLRSLISGYSVFVTSRHKYLTLFCKLPPGLYELDVRRKGFIANFRH